MDRQTCVPAHDELFRACTILFGKDIDLSQDFLLYIQLSGIKSAYRRKALETHPDSVSALRAEQDCGPGADRFIETNWAYNQLLDFIKCRDSGIGPFIMAANRSRPKKRPRWHAEAAREETQGARQCGSYFKGEVPGRRLLFGQFLFYSGEVPWEALIRAIVWQRNQRPRLGELARRWGWATEESIRDTMGQRRLGEPLGEALVRLNLLSNAQLKSLLNRQQFLQQPFGEYFVQNNFITKARLHQLFRDFKTHNGRQLRNFSTYSRI